MTETIDAAAFQDPSLRAIGEQLADGDVKQAIEAAKAIGRDDIADKIRQSIQFIESPDAYREYYKQDWEGIEHRIPGGQIIQGWGLDERQSEAKEQVAALGKTLLDIGCADGTFIFNLLHDNTIWYAEGIDPWLSGIRWAQDFAVKNFYGKTVWHQGVFEDLWPYESFDAVHLGEILEHVPDPIHILDRAVRCLANKKSGIVVTVPVKRPPLSPEEFQLLLSGGVNQHVRYVDEAALAKFADQCGLEITHKKQVGNVWINLVATLQKKGG
jgi:2-polyprenyl-3-methyl-5-hydroxy-6-metoxy-1,4-benzoquinol methylase